MQDKRGSLGHLHGMRCVIRRSMLHTPSMKKHGREGG
jgi:hypothetical protein